MQGLVPSPGTLIGHVGLPGAVFPPRFALTQRLRLFVPSGLAPGIPLGIRQGDSTIPDADLAAFTAAPPSDCPACGPWLQGVP